MKSFYTQIKYIDSVLFLLTLIYTVYFISNILSYKSKTPESIIIFALILCIFGNLCALTYFNILYKNYEILQILSFAFTIICSTILLAVIPFIGSHFGIEDIFIIHAYKSASMFVKYVSISFGIKVLYDIYTQQ